MFIDIRACVKEPGAVLFPTAMSLIAGGRGRPHMFNFVLASANSLSCCGMCLARLISSPAYDSAADGVVAGRIILDRRALKQALRTSGYPTRRAFIEKLDICGST
ncbi:hypothetical protein CABS01_08870 [Colletotrichum abscissum]|uniref:uncharacterized protein n=1 Tax=Colletotrichum abscissum TaxID=1671311 RepID=UPI0027D542E7|nr:uncharacterized protein CABS01_08870 [Colletotrichum abscissum]KAK1505092.1 hypothetical protein CABS01_08870 [Colletotrichum abscissum]